MTATSPSPPAITDGSTAQAPGSASAAGRRGGWSPDRLAYGFYAVAASGAVIGQTWVALMHAPLPSAVPGLVRAAVVLPFAACLELLAMALAAMADARMRLGERAYGFRTFSAVVAAIAVGILIVGHWPQWYWSVCFGVLSGSAYLLWLLHSAARRRDALRAAGKLADTAPDYGLWRRLRHPVWTARAAELARQGRPDPEHGWRPLGLFESLRAAQLAIRADQRRPALARAVEQVVRADRHDPRMAEVAVRTLDLDRLAAELADRVDYPAWADRLAPAITAPQLATGGEIAGTPHGAPPLEASSTDTDPSGASAPPTRPANEQVAARLDAPPVPAAHPATLPASRPEPALPVRAVSSVALDEPAAPASSMAGAATTTGHRAATGDDPPAPWTAYHDNTPERRPDAPDDDTTTAASGIGQTPPATTATATSRGQPADKDPSGNPGQPPAPSTATAPSGYRPADDAEPAGTPPSTPPATEQEQPGPPDPDADDSEAHARDIDGHDEEEAVPGDTAAAVAYWYRQDPSLHPADIATRIGRSERTVRRHWPPAPPRTANGHDTSDLANRLHAS